MKAIWKFLLSPSGIVEMPEGAKVLAVQTQHNQSCIWAIVDEKAAKVTRRFEIFGTGHQLPDDIESMTYIGTFQMNDGYLVFHVFESQAA